MYVFYLFELGFFCRLVVISNFLKNVITIEKWGVGYLPTQQSMVVVVVVDVEKVVVFN